jgi:hypothetical protein
MHQQLKGCLWGKTSGHVIHKKTAKPKRNREDDPLSQAPMCSDTQHDTLVTHNLVVWEASRRKTQAKQRLSIPTSAKHVLKQPNVMYAAATLFCKS